MKIKKTPFTFLEDFSIIPMDSGSFMVEQGLTFSRGFSDLGQVVAFLIVEKELFLLGIPIATMGPSHSEGYEYYDKTGTPKKPDEDSE